MSARPQFSSAGFTESTRYDCDVRRCDNFICLPGTEAESQDQLPAYGWSMDEEDDGVRSYVLDVCPGHR